MKIIYRILETEIDPAYYLRAKKISEEINYIKPKKVLDTGCGRGFYIKLLTYFDFIDEIRGVELNENYIEIAKSITKDSKTVSIEQGSIYSLPFEDNYFDLVICSEVLEHLDNDRQGLEEIHRVIKQNGTLLVTVPNKNFPFLWDPLNWILMKLFNTHINKDIWWLAGIWADHERLYTVEEIKSLLEEKFFIEDTEEYISWCWPFAHFLFYGIGKNLVELFSFKEFNRFDFKKDKKMSRFLARIIALPGVILDPLFPSKSSMNIFMKARKKSD